MGKVAVGYSGSRQVLSLNLNSLLEVRIGVVRVKLHVQRRESSKLIIIIKLRDIIMSKQVATLLVGLLALAEGRSTDRNLLREADREDVLEEIDHETLDRIAHRLYADE